MKTKRNKKTVGWLIKSLLVFSLLVGCSTSHYECHANFSDITCPLIGADIDGNFDPERCVQNTYPNCYIDEKCTDYSNSDMTDTDSGTEKTGIVCVPVCAGTIESCQWLSENECKERNDCYWDVRSI
jgi:hypothetical protein